MLPGVEKWVPTICGQCMGGCGILVRVIDGWAVNIAGNPLHPVNRGTLCPKGIAGLQGLYDPDRIRSPLKRIGKRGEGRWQPISWDEALQAVTDSLKDLRRNGEPHRLAVLGGKYRGLMRSLWERFLEAFGSPNYIDQSVPVGRDTERRTLPHPRNLLDAGLRFRKCAISPLFWFGTSRILLVPCPSSEGLRPFQERKARTERKAGSNRSAPFCHRYQSG